MQSSRKDKGKRQEGERETVRRKGRVGYRKGLLVGYRKGLLVGYRKGLLKTSITHVHHFVIRFVYCCMAKHASWCRWKLMWSACCDRGVSNRN